MRYTVSAIVLAAISVFVAQAIDISGAPACAQTCLTDNLNSTTCDPDSTDTTCFCADTTYYNAVSSCVLSTCSLTDALATLTWYDTECPSS